MGDGTEQSYDVILAEKLELKYSGAGDPGDGHPHFHQD